MALFRPHILIALAFLATLTTDAPAQEIFHSLQSANLPTAEMLPQGSWLFEISHRFDTPVSQGAEAFWGLDGPVFNRLGLSWSPTDHLLLGVLRSNFNDNLELNARVGALDVGGVGIPLKVGFLGGIAWNTEVFEQPTSGAEDNEIQLYGQLIVNAGLGDRVALGLVPTYLWNPRIDDLEAVGTLVLGVHGQIYLNRSLSVLGEWLVAESREGLEHDPVSVGLEIETRGHFFKLMISNQSRLNPTQYLGGTPTPFALDEWRLGFNIVRLLPF